MASIGNFPSGGMPIKKPGEQAPATGASESSTTSDVKKRSTDTSTKILEQSSTTTGPSSISEGHKITQVRSEPKNDSAFKQGLDKLVDFAKKGGKTVAALVQGKLTPASKEAYRNFLISEALHNLYPEAILMKDKFMQDEADYVADSKLTKALGGNDGERIKQKEAKEAFESMEPGDQKAIMKQALDLAKDIQDPEKADSKELNNFKFNNNLYIQANPEVKNEFLGAKNETENATLMPEAHSEQQEQVNEAPPRAPSGRTNWSASSPTQNARSNIVMGSERSAETKFQKASLALSNLNKEVEEFLDGREYLQGSSTSQKDTDQVMSDTRNLIDRFEAAKDEFQSAIKNAGHSPPKENNPLLEFDNLRSELSEHIKDAVAHKQMAAKREAYLNNNLRVINKLNVEQLNDRASNLDQQIALVNRKIAFQTRFGGKAIPEDSARLQDLFILKNAVEERRSELNRNP